MNTLSTIVEPGSINYSARYNFIPGEHGRCQMSRKGNIVLNRRLANMVLGINFSNVAMRIVGQTEENDHIRSLVMGPVWHSHFDQIPVIRYKNGGILVLDSLIYKLNYKRFKFSFISEPTLLEDGSLGIRLTLENRRLWLDMLPDHYL